MEKLFMRQISSASGLVSLVNNASMVFGKYVRESKTLKDT
jgi:hypothetical protein